MTSLPSFYLPDYLSDRLEIVNTELNDLLRTSGHDGHDRRIVEAMRYALIGNGKRLRPTLCIAAAEAAGGNYMDVLPAACALEMIHTYSLIHDDLPAMDDDRLRRGKPTCHLAFDEATAILAGDALLTMAFEILATPDDHPSNLQVRLKVIRIIARAAGYCGMIEGQMRDIRFEGKPLYTDELKSLYDLKTGALIKAAVETGAQLTGCESKKIAALNEYADNIGLAFQVADDILNVEGDPVRMGKAVGTDASRNKNTYPALLGLEASKTYASELVDSALASLASFDHRADPLREIAKYIIDRKR